MPVETLSQHCNLCSTDPPFELTLSISFLSNGLQPELSSDLWAPSALPFLSAPSHCSLSLFVCGQLNSRDGGDGALLEPCWFEWLEKPHLLLAHGVSRRFVRLLWSPPTSPCPINHFLSKLSLFDWGNQEFPLYLPLISKPALPLNTKWWFWDDPRTGRTTWWAKSDVIYCICACAKASETQCGAITQSGTDLHIRPPVPLRLAVILQHFQGFPDFNYLQSQ